MSTGKELAKAYYDGLKEAYFRCDGQEIWDRFASVAQGASQEDIDWLLKFYPDTPESLIQLLRLVDGTYYREYPKDKVLFYFLGSDCEGIPYYLLSARQMVKTKDQFRQWGDYLIRREEDILVDEGVCDDMEKLNLLHFADCFNNGGTSQLFLDFSPSVMGIKGQVLRYLHDADELVIVADSFDAYLQMLMEEEYPFLDEESMEDMDI